MFRRLFALFLTFSVCGLLLFRESSLSTSGEQTPAAKATPPAENAVTKPGSDFIALESEQPQIAPLKPGATKAEMLAPFLAAARKGGAEVVSDTTSYDDFPSLAQTSDGTLYVAHASFANGSDQIRVRRRINDGQWSTPMLVPLVQPKADIWMPQIGVDANDRLWVIWCEQTGQTPEKSGNWDLYARSFANEKWGQIIRLSDNPKPDINPHVAVDKDRNIHVVWQAHPNNNGDIQYCKFDGKSWSKPLAVTSDAESDWYPHVAIDKEGTAWIAFDSYRNGDYDVFLTAVRAEKLDKVIPIAESAYYEAHASVACAPDGKVWVAWEQGGHSWGKDRGYWPQRQVQPQGAYLGCKREVKVACYSEGKVLATPSISNSLPAGGGPYSSAMAELAVGEGGDLWLAFRRTTQVKPPGRAIFMYVCTQYVTRLTKNGWAKSVEQPASIGRVTVFSRFLPDRDGSLWLAYSSDARVINDLHQPVQDLVLVKQFAKPAEPASLPEMPAYEPPPPPAVAGPWNAQRERRQVAAARDYRVSLKGKPYRILRGDIHRHTEMSWDSGPGDDGSFLDFYRYVIDVASLDFGCLTDHLGGNYDYWWWLIGKSADMYDLAPRYVSLFGYERSVEYPNGHRNVYYSRRGVPIFGLQRKGLDVRIKAGATRELAPNDTKLLYRHLHETDGITISHSSGTMTMGTDWRDNDPVVEPVVELYQGVRLSYETLGGPRAPSDHRDFKMTVGGFQTAGLVWNAYAKGYRLGTISSSDHFSTHISYGMVYAIENNRESILDAIRQRRTYGATDNLILEFHAGDHFMGEEFRTKDQQVLVLRATGTAVIKQLDLIRNQKYIFTSNPQKETVAVDYIDMQPDAGLNLYYFRIEQADGEVAWSSPIWVNYEKQ